MQGAWVSFARDPTRGLVNYGWPTYQASTSSLAVLGNSKNETGVTFVTGTSVDTGCGAVETIEDIVNLVSSLLGLDIRL
jgi:hypothetical protein